ncbi:uncharacterized protein LOC126776124 isoform X1 [Nymphalis io]|uniref:uncharacterized protein LOC126776124 isoform X1 n=1 Tax=Inachis io TaxID=171585 RepID=UPI0021690163|nr:uncharacterized protein LOC126776124 isoform X1 [Nymphalis io]XP_050354375.1 uncharacterized protein LOC126776124 isoform X1 [Nymphalis io]
MSNRLQYILILLQYVFIVPVCLADGRVEVSTPKLPQKKQHKKYNPMYGYEPYWEDGDWVFAVKLPKGNVSTTSVPQVCGEECFYLYTSIGKVCGRKADHVSVDGCDPWSYRCNGETVDDQTSGYKTFDTYCKFLDAQCRSSFNKKWIFVHEGPCVVPQNLLFKPLLQRKEPLKRIKTYFTNLVEAFNNRTLPNPLE